MEENEVILRLLLDNGGDVNMMDRFALTPLFLAVDQASSAILLIILQHEPNKEAICCGDTPLHKAVRENRISHADLLISYGYSVDALNRDRITPIQLAQRLNYGGILSHLDNPVNRQRLQMLPKSAPAIRRVERLKDRPPDPQPVKREEKPPQRPPEPVRPAPKKEPVFVPEKQTFQPYQPSGQIWVNLDDYMHLHNRVLTLEKLISESPACCICRSRPGLATCPVCGFGFCTSDWTAHVSRGCRS
jgi:hypothetical protein